MSTSDYDTLHYPSYIHPRTHPAFLSAIGRLLGHDLAPMAGARVLEIGTSDGANILPMASFYPETTFIGVDPAAGRIREGVARAEAAGLKNVTLEAVGAEGVEVAPGSVDYILVHGVFGWVSREIQQGILDLCARALSPRGVAYLSYNTRPGWTDRMLVSDFLRTFNRGADPPSWCTGAESLLRGLQADVRQDEGGLGAAVAEALQTLTAGDRSYFFHEYGGMAHEAWYFHEVEARCRAAGLTWIGEAGLFGCLTPEMHRPRGGWPAAVDGDPIKVQQYLDYILHRYFRRSLFMGPLASPAPFTGLRAERMGASVGGRGLRVGGDLRPTTTGVDLFSKSPVSFRLSGGKTLSDARPLIKAAYLCLSEAWPRLMDAEALLEAARSRIAWSASPNPEKDRALLFSTLLSGFSAGELLIQGDGPELASEAGARPKVNALARVDAAAGAEDVVGAYHGRIRVEGSLASLVTALDGTRSVEALLDEAPALPSSLSSGESVRTGAVGMGDILSHLARGALLSP